jgi:hypothetical protein
MGTNRIRVIRVSFHHVTLCRVTGSPTPPAEPYGSAHRRTSTPSVGTGAVEFVVPRFQAGSCSAG